MMYSIKIFVAYLEPINKDSNHITINEVNEWALKHHELYPKYTELRKRSLK